MIIRYAANTLLIGVMLAATSSFAMAAEKGKTDAQVKKAIIKESIASYPGNCPCPFSVARNGSRCGKRSAYSKPRGYSPICYESDVNQEMIKEWRDSHKKAE